MSECAATGNKMPSGALFPVMLHGAFRKNPPLRLTNRRLSLSSPSAGRNSTQLSSSSLTCGWIQ